MADEPQNALPPQSATETTPQSTNEPSTTPQQTETTTPTEPAPTSATTETKPAKEPSLTNKEPTKEEAPAGAPEKYEDFKLPEGITINADAMTAAQAIFKDLNLPQDAAQKLVDFHVGQMKLAAEASDTAVSDMRNGWRKEIGSDPKLGKMVNGAPEISKEVHANIGRLYATLPAEQVTAFKEAIDLTGAGDHPAFLRVFNTLAERLTEGRPVAGGNPAPAGQVNPANPPKSMANAFYPKLPSAN